MAKTFVVKKSASKSTPKAQAEPPTAAPPTPVEKTPTARIHVGATSGLHVMEYQDKTFFDQPKKKLTDEQILADWRREFPNTKGKWVKDDRTGLVVVALVRRFYNEKRHGNQKLFSDQPIPRYGDKGQVIPEQYGQPRGAKATQKAEADAAKAEAESAAVASTKVKRVRPVKKAA